jgi:parallel beta helix pectate lyase-like protein/pectate lyase-like protein
MDSRAGRAPIDDAREETRRSILAKAGLLGGSVGLYSLLRPAQTFGTHSAPPPPAAATGTFKVNDVKDWGARGDGTHEDRTYIQQCIDDSAGKAAVYFPPGQYIVNNRATGAFASLDVPSNSVLLGCGPLSEIKRTATDNHDFPIIAIDDGAVDVSIENLKVTGDGSPRRPQPLGDSGQCIRAGSVSGGRIFIRHVECSFASNRGITVGPGVKDVTIENCYVHHCNGDGIDAYGAENIAIVGNLVRYCGDDHIAVGSVTASIVGNVCDASKTSSGAAIAARFGSQVVQIAGNTCRGGWQAGIVVNAGKEIGVVGNMLTRAGVSDQSIGNPGPRGTPEGSGIALYSPAGIANQVHISDNVLVGSFAHGIKVNPVTNPIHDVSINDNLIGSSGGKGIYLVGGINRCDVTGNHVTDSGAAGTQQPGIQADAVQDLMVVGNRSQDTRVGTGRTQGPGLKLVSVIDPLLVTNNNFHNNVGVGIDDSASPGGTDKRILENIGDTRITW